MKRIYYIIVILPFLLSINTFGQLAIQNQDQSLPSPIINQERAYTPISVGAETFIPRGTSSNWVVTGGVITSFNSNTDAVTVRWTKAGEGQLQYSGLTRLQYNSGPPDFEDRVFINVVTVKKSISVKDLANPETYFDTSVVYKNCVTAVLKTRGDIPATEAWYWQFTANGTSKDLKVENRLTQSAGSSGTPVYETDNNMIIAASGSYYIRAYTISTGAWSGAKKVQVDFAAQTFSNYPNWYPDTDGDGYGEPSTSPIAACLQPTGYVDNNLDQCPTEYGKNQGCATPNYIAPKLSADQNYIYTAVPQVPVKDITDIKNRYDLIEGVTYMDGLGRSIKNIAIGQSPKGNDMISFSTYNNMGKEVKKYLPYVAKTTSGAYSRKINDTEDNPYEAKKFYQNYLTENSNPTRLPNVIPYAEVLYDNTPGSPPLKQAAPGLDWAMGSGHEVQLEHEFNTENEVRKYGVSYPANDLTQPTLVDKGFYTYKELHKSTIIDPDKKITETFTNTLGQVVLTRKSHQKLDTYTVYDDYGNVSFVLSPKVKVTDGISNTEINELGYQYRYNTLGQLVEKKDPGKGWERIVYNVLGQAVLVQSAKLKTQNKWLLTKYDFFGRTIYTGIYTDSRSRSELQAILNTIPKNALYETKTSTPIPGFENQLYYTNTVFPMAIAELHSINYYDDYTFDRTSNPKAIPADTIYAQAITTNTLDFATGTKEKVLGTNHWITSLLYYDKDGSAVYTFSDNPYLKTTDVVQLQHDFTGKILKSRSYHKKGANTEIVTVDTFTYDHTGRLLDQKQCIGDRTLPGTCGDDIVPQTGTSQNVEVIASNTYDELGQLKNKKVGGTSSTEATRSAGLQTIDYNYNIRGWLTHINDPDADLGDDLFAYKMDYNKTKLSLGSGYHNGNINATHWKTANDPKKYSYSYSYDDKNRLTNASYFAENKIQTTALYADFSYDKNGNITHIFRYGNANGGPIDYLDYTYDVGNKLLKVKDQIGNPKGFKDGTNSGNDYAYDIDGNMTQDLNKGITNITYNHLDLPTKITVVQGGKTATTEMVYTAGGSKLSKTTTVDNIPKTTQYAGSFVYTNNNPHPEYIHFAEGYIEPKNTGGYQYVYQYTDHLGNVRLSYADDNGDGKVTKDEIREEKHYSPFGLQHKYATGDPRNVVRGRKHNYGFNGIELNQDLGVDLYEMPLRSYDPAIARWTTQDPVIHHMYSPYSAFDNNPVYYSDPSGADSEPIPYHDSFGYNWRADTYSGRYGTNQAFAGAFGESWTNPVSDFTDDNIERLDQVVIRFVKTSKTWIGLDGFSTRGTVNSALRQIKNNIQNGYIQDGYRQGQMINTSGVANDSGWRSAPLLGNAIESYDWFARGDTSRGLLYAGLAISDAFAVRALAVSGTKLITQQLAKQAAKNTIRQGAYDGVKSASKFLQDAGVPRAYRKQILQSFEVETIALKTADNSTFGIRFFGGNANASGRYLFPTFTNSTNRVGLALPYKWNSMTGLKQFQVAPGSQYIFGRAASQGGRFTGGHYQMYINNLDNLIGL